MNANSFTRTCRVDESIVYIYIGILNKIIILYKEQMDMRCIYFKAPQNLS
jgi:hypothetical protein